MLALIGSGVFPSPASWAAVCDVYAVVAPNWKEYVVRRRLGFTTPTAITASDVMPDVAPVTTSGGANSYAPMSHAEPLGRPNPGGSVSGQPLRSPASIAGLPDSRATVSVAPPLLTSGP